MGFVVLKSGRARDPAELRLELVQLVRDRVGPVASFKDVAVVDRLPKTRSGKILRATMRHIADGTDYSMPATVEDATALDDIAVAVKSLGGTG
jgi:propionyl-CoA synthetase